MQMKKQGNSSQKKLFSRT